jgi:branched-chain amino acid transport system ATP-binding protein
MSAPDIILKLSNIESYYGPIMAIRGISIEVPRGRIVALLGANGAGKTTVLKTISGILDPQKGSIEFLGKPIQRMEADKIVRLGVSHVPEGREVFPFLSVRENLMMGAYPRKDRDAVADDLELVYGYFPRLRERLNQPAGQLSGGEQQMLAIGRALMNRPTLLLLDEPSLGLSPILVREIFTIWSGRSSRSSSASTRSRARRSCWSSKTPRWRWRPRITAMSSRSAASS